jgi:hypothetical protein
VKAWRPRTAILLLGLTVTVTGCGRGGRSATEMRKQIAALEAERDQLRKRIDELLVADVRLEGMPQTEVRFGVPTPLARMLITRVLSGFVDQVTLVLENLKVHKAGKVKKVITIGEYDLNVRIDKVVGRLRTGDPEIRFGGNRVSVALPIEIASGSGDATIHFVWDGKNVSGAVCGDMDVTEIVGGDVKPDTYPVQGGLELTATTQQILAAPRFPPLKVNLKVQPSSESWDRVRAIIESKGGLCGFVLDKVDIPGILEKLVGKGFNVRLPTEKIKPMAVPVGIEPKMTIQGREVTLGVENVDLAITEHVIWLGADVDVTADEGASATGDDRGARRRRVLSS